MSMLAESLRPLAAILEALADPHRLAILMLLRKGKRSSGDLAQALSMDLRRVSNYLQTLKRHGIVRVLKRGRYRFYELAGFRPERSRWVLSKTSFEFSFPATAPASVTHPRAGMLCTNPEDETDSPEQRGPHDFRRTPEEIEAQG